MSIERWDFGTISYPVPYKFEIGRMWRKRRIVTVQGCEFGMKFLKPARGGGKKLFGRRHHSRDSSRWRNFNWPFAVGTKIGFHRWWPGHIIPGPRLRGRHGISVLTGKVSAIERQVAFVRHRDRIDNL